MSPRSGLWGLCFSLGLGLLLTVSMVISSARAVQCNYYNKTMCMAGISHGCNGTDECKPSESEKETMCYSLYKNTSEGSMLSLKGCWVGGHDCINKSSCTETRREPNIQLFFCCCEGELCNTDNKFDLKTMISPTIPVTQLTTGMPIQRATDGASVVTTLVYGVIAVVTLLTGTVAFFFFYRRRKMGRFNELPTSEPSPIPPPSPSSGLLRPIQLKEVKAQGRFGSVWRAQMLSEIVAVKVFPPEDRNSWFVEQEVFSLPQMKHPNLLYYYGCEKHGESLQSEYWLITAYHEKGSLSDYLKANLINWMELLKIVDSISRGLTHLHEEMPPFKGETYKPAIAHRDFKSKNVLLKSDMTACIADFGLALVFYQGQPPGGTHGQVGTRRYMAPEVLEGAINFNRDAFLKIDMYAFGLVLWEVLSRCSAQEGPVEEYMLPFEEEIGQHPTLEDMQDLVVQKKVRPKFKESWTRNSCLSPLCVTIEECWDHDTDARLSASCVQERVSLLYKTPFPTSTSQTLLNTEIKSSSTSNCLTPLIVNTQTVFHSREPSM